MAGQVWFMNPGLELGKSLFLGRRIGEAKSKVEYLKPVKEKGVPIRQIYPYCDGFVHGEFWQMSI